MVYTWLCFMSTLKDPSTSWMVRSTLCLGIPHEKCFRHTSCPWNQSEARYTTSYHHSFARGQSWNSVAEVQTPTNPECFTKWYIYLHEWLILMVNLGKYTYRSSHGSYGMVLFFFWRSTICEIWSYGEMIGSKGSCLVFRKWLGGGFKLVFFTPTWGNDPIWLYNIFQMVWNHKLDENLKNRFFCLAIYNFTPPPNMGRGQFPRTSTVR